MIFRKSTIVTLAILTIAMLPTSVSYAQFWEALKEIGKGVGSVVLENYIDNNPNYSSEVKQSMKNDLNTINNAININQNAANATRDAYNGNYTGAVIQGAQTIMNATGNYQYDTYLNSANQINNANRDYNQNINNGMDRQEALDKRNKTIGYSAAESAIELQDKIARERAEKARQQREAEQKSWESNSYYTTPSYNNYNESNPKTSTSSFNQNSSANVPEASWEILREYGAGNKGSVNQSAKEDTSDGLEESWQILRDYANGKTKNPSDNNIENRREYNLEMKLLSVNNPVVFISDNGDEVSLLIKEDMRGNSQTLVLGYENKCDEKHRLVCNRVTIKVKYYDDDEEYTFSDACAIELAPCSYIEDICGSRVHIEETNYLALSDAFFSLDQKKNIERIRISFVDTQIK